MAGYPVALSQEEFVRRVSDDPDWRSFVLDSREVRPGIVFFALPGERTDGHHFVKDAIRRGARAVVLYRSFFVSHEQSLLEEAGLGTHVDESPLAAGSDEYPDLHCVFVPVEDSLICLQEAGRAVLQASGAYRIGITGSNGKTGTKDLLAAVLSRGAAVHASKGNYNSVLGLPVVMAATPRNSRYAVLEMAMSERGEMARLAELVLPQAALLTNIGTAHIGNIGSREGIAEEKFAIFSQMNASDLAVIPATDSWAMQQLKKSPLKCRVSMYGLTEEFGFSLVFRDLTGTRFRYRGNEYFLPEGGEHVLHNAVGVITLCLELGIDPQKIREGLAAYKLPPGRGRIIQGDSIVIDDSYNANPDSMKAAFASARNLADIHGGRRLLFVLGDMKELGSESHSSHEQTLEAALEFKPYLVLLLGEDFTSAAAELSRRSSLPGDRVLTATEMGEFQLLVRNTIKPGDIVLVKGSRSMALEKLIPFIPGIGEDGSV